MKNWSSLPKKESCFSTTLNSGRQGVHSKTLGIFFHTIYAEDGRVWFIYISSSSAKLKVTVFDEVGNLIHDLKMPDYGVYAQLVPPYDKNGTYRLLVNNGEDRFDFYEVKSDGQLFVDEEFKRVFEKTGIQFGSYVDMSQFKFNNWYLLVER